MILGFPDFRRAKFFEQEQNSKPKIEKNKIVISKRKTQSDSSPKNKKQKTYFFANADCLISDINFPSLFFQNLPRVIFSAIKSGMRRFFTITGTVAPKYRKDFGLKTAILWDNNL